MTSRLLNMKFMQRAAAAQASNPSSPSTPSSDRPSKRQRLSTGGSVGIASPATPTAPDPAEIKRQQALDRAAAEAGETKWVLSVQQQRRRAVDTPMKIVTAGYGAIDSADIPAPAHLAVAMAAQSSHSHNHNHNHDNDTSDDEDEDEGLQQSRPGLQGRRSFGRFNKALERAQNPDMSSSESEAAEGDSQDGEDDESEEDDEDDDDDDPVAALVKQQRRETAERLRQERRAKKRADLAEAEKLAKERRKREIKLNRTSGTGISSGGQNSSGRRSNNMADMECHVCGQKGHLKRDCPQLRNQSARSWTR